MAIVKGFTPDQRGPTLGDGAGGTSERPEARTADPVIRQPGWVTKDIRLTGDTDVSVGEGVLYDFGEVTKDSIGRYLGEYQAAASATADPLGTRSHCEFFITEATAGVFTAVTRLDDEGGTATDDADDPSASSTLITAVVDADLTGTGSDSRVTFFVAVAQDVTDAAAWTAPATLVVGRLYVMAAIAETDVVTLRNLA